PDTPPDTPLDQIQPFTEEEAETTPIIDIETVRLGESTFPVGAVRVLADVDPFQIVGGHVSFSSAPVANVTLIAAEITDAGIQHAVIMQPSKTFDISQDQSLYHAELGSPISGDNPFAELGISRDTVTNFTDLLLWNDSPNDIAFSGDDYVTITLILQ
ncbi:MAG: hypothetical protein WA941_15035, partial [Nitrososphaeraceae archaeon]